MSQIENMIENTMPACKSKTDQWGTNPGGEELTRDKARIAVPDLESLNIF